MKKEKTNTEEKVEAEQVNTKPKKAKKPIDTSKGGLVWTIWHYTEALLLIVLGVLAIIYSSDKNIQGTFIIIVGAFIIADGALRVLMNFLPIFSVKEKAKLAYNFVVTGSVELALGITLIVERSLATDIAIFFSYFLAIIFIVAGISFLLFAIGFIVSKLYKLYMPILEIILALALIAVGVVILIYMNPNDSKTADVFYQVVLIICGVVVILAGVGNLISTSTTLIVENKKKRVLKAAASMKEQATATEMDFTNKPSEATKPEEESKPIEASSETPTIEEKKPDDPPVIDAHSEDKKD